MALDFWFDNQLRRYWLQFCRIFEGWQYQTGVGADGTTSFRTFPVKLASKDRQIGHLLRNNSENTLTATPRVSVYMSDLTMSAERRQFPSHVSAVNVVERAIDPITNTYTSERGNSYTVERLMPVPYDMEMTVDVWTSNEMQKHQFMEQVMQLFNPAIDLQTGTNPIDWTALTYVELMSINWSNRTFPMGDSGEIEISTMTFKVPVWINPPSKIKRQNIIHQIITNIATVRTGEVDEFIGSAEGIHFSDNDLHTRIIVTPQDLMINVSGSEITLLNKHGVDLPELSWRDTLNLYGKFRPGVSQIRLKTTADMDDHDTDIIGTYDLHPTEQNKLLWTIDHDTLPTNTLSPITAMITLFPTAPELQGKAPGRGLPNAAAGQRYLLAEDLEVSEGGDNGWTNLKASANDIIEYDGTRWNIVFDASAVTSEQWVLNLTSGKQLRWTGEMWVMSVDGVYRPGFWRIFL